MKFFEPERLSHQLEKMNAEERKYVEERYKRIKRQELIKKVMDK